MNNLVYRDVGIFFQNARVDQKGLTTIKTLNLDKLARAAAIFTNHYAGAPVSVPSRASLISGKNQGQANVRNIQFDKAIENNPTFRNSTSKKWI